MDSAPGNQPVIVMAPPRQTVWWVIAICLAVIATALIVRPGGGPFALPSAYADTPMAGARGIFAFTGQIDTNRYGLFMMDVDTRNVWCYEYLPSARTMKLVFARSFDFDRYLSDFNLDPMTNPDHIKKLLDEHQKIKERKARSGGLSTSVPGLPPQDEPAVPTGKP